MRGIHRLFVLALYALATGCSGGGTGTPIRSVPGPTPSPTPTTGSGPTARAQTTLKLSIDRSSSVAAAKSHARRRDYISSDTNGAVVVATSTTGATANNGSFGYDLSSSSSLCTTSGSVETCTLVFPLYADSYAIAITTYDQVESDATASAPVGNVLSTAVQPETVTVGVANTFSTITLHGVVATFGFSGASTLGAVGGTASSASIAFSALDADMISIDAGANPTTYANAPIAVLVVDGNDSTGCAPSCITATNDVGTSSETTTATTGATISSASDETFTVAYSGKGAVGMGIEGSVGGAAPGPGTPYVGRISVTGTAGTATARIAPIFAYPTSATISGTGTAYIWAAQGRPPSSADPGGASYTAYFGTAGTATCSNGIVPLATVGSPTYYPAYGAVFPVTELLTGVGSGATCTLSLSDGASTPDVTTATLTLQ